MFNKFSQIFFFLLMWKILLYNSMVWKKRGRRFCCCCWMKWAFWGNFLFRLKLFFEFRNVDQGGHKKVWIVFTSLMCGSGEISFIGYSCFYIYFFFIFGNIYVEISNDHAFVTDKGITTFTSRKRHKKFSHFNWLVPLPKMFF